MREGVGGNGRRWWTRPLAHLPIVGLAGHARVDDPVPGQSLVKTRPMLGVMKDWVGLWQVLSRPGRSEEVRPKEGQAGLRQVGKLR